MQTNDNASFLPASAESTLVADEVAGFNDQESFPALVVITRPDGGVLTPADLAEADALAQAIPTLAIGEGTVADYLDPTPVLTFPSQDGMAALISVPLKTDAISERVDAAGPRPGHRRHPRTCRQVPDLQVNVTGR